MPSRSKLGVRSFSLRDLFLPTAFLGLLSMTGCESPVALYHQAEGGDIAHQQQPPPGSDLPYPNLASVPPAPDALTLSEVQTVQQQLAAARAAPELPAGSADPAADVALGGLTLPSAAPPTPNVPGINWAGLPQPVVPVRPAPPKPAPAAKLPDGPPILLAFDPKSAILNIDGQAALKALALARGDAMVRVGGFGEQNSAPDGAALRLGVARARRIADALTAAGVPPAAITMTASADGYGGFAQLVY